MMMNSGSGRLIVANGSGKGVIYKKAGRQVPPRDVITWHDVNPYRIWIHSRLKDQGFISVSLEIQVLGSGLKDRAVNMNEAQAREQLASLIEANTDDAYRLNPRIWRNIQVGSLMGAHSILVRDIQIALTSEVSPKLTLVEEGAVKISKLRESKPSKNGLSGFDKEIRASTRRLPTNYIHLSHVCLCRFEAGSKQSGARIKYRTQICLYRSSNRKKKGLANEHRYWEFWWSNDRGWAERVRNFRGS
jgi:hypothetical protein